MSMANIEASWSSVEVSLSGAVSGKFVSGERLHFDIVISNIDGADTYNCAFYICELSSAETFIKGTEFYSFGATTIDPGTAFAYTMPYGTEPALPPPTNGRAEQMAIRLECTDSNGNLHVEITPMDLWTMDRVYNPKIVVFDPVRYSTVFATVAEDGECALTDAGVSIDIGDNEELPSGFAISATCIPDDDETKGITFDLTDRFADLRNGVIDSLDLITGEYSAASSWEITMRFGDGYEDDSKTAILYPLTDIPLHISGAERGGVSIGAFSTSTDENPKFECHYPAYFYNDVTFSNNDIILPEVSETDNGKVLMVVEGKWSLGNKGSSGVSPASAFKTINADMFAGYTEIESVDLPEATSLGHRAFQNCTGLKTVNLPLMTSNGVSIFQGCTSLERVDLGAVTSLLNYTFTNCSSLQTLILRTDALVTITTYVFTGSGIANKTGYVYVPASLVDSYKANNVWKTYASQIRAIEDYPEITS